MSIIHDPALYQLRHALRGHVYDPGEPEYEDARTLFNAMVETRPRHVARVSHPHQISAALAFVETPAYERFLSPDEAQEVLHAVNDFHPLGRHGQPGDVVEAILFLAGGEAGWITGTTLPVDGGVLAGRSPALHAEVEAAA